MLNNKYKIIFIDIDGTLVDDEKRISEETIQVIKKLKQQGVCTVLASGKPYGSIKSFSEKCFATPYIIGSNGAVVRDIEKQMNLFTKSIQKEDAIKIVNIVKQNGIYTMVTVSGNSVTEAKKFGMSPKNRPELIQTQSLVEYLKQTEEPVLKISIMDHDESKIKKLREQLVASFDFSITPVDGFIIPQGFKEPGEDEPDPYCIDVMQKGITKKHAIETLLQHLQIDLSQTMAFGDGRNDIEMFETVGYKVAMGNAVPELKQIADKITKSNNESGVAVALNEIFFGI